ncbi:uncharacterized protein LOC122369812 isoform X2 [Amphibalanus amphitrite]|nr:uncharacterized protein LOC122369812 isoform X2 [Amphibalanus amphitrite]
MVSVTSLIWRKCRRYRKSLLAAAVLAGLLLLQSSALWSQPATASDIYWLTGAATYRPPECDCSRRLPDPSNSPLVRSHCGPEADARGPGQNVISYSFYGSNYTAYLRGAAMNAKRARRLYPGWVMRVYYHGSQRGGRWGTEYCRVRCAYDHVDFCDVSRLEGFGELGRQRGSIWRFLVMDDPTVRRYIVRDLDSLITERERAAVQEWLDSNKTFHVMRDSPHHGSAILAGMWGGDNARAALYRPLIQQLIRPSWPAVRIRLRVLVTFSDERFWDQVLLEFVLWPEMSLRRDVMVHDSYHCQSDPLSRPWPTQRKDREDFVGYAELRYYDKLPEECPPACRPPDHQDWLWC